ncbi:MAG: DUF167 domain-containing protein [Pseudonocardia sp.]
MKVAVRVRPGARADAVGGCWDGPRGAALLVAVRARAVEGKANAAVVDLVATAFGLRRADVTIGSGHHGRDKILELTGDDAVLAARLVELRGS